MEINIINMEGPLSVVSLEGDMDLYNATQVKTRILGLWEKRRDSIVLDMNKLNYLDSSGIGTIIKLYAESRTRGIGFILADAPGPIMRVMELTKLVGFLPFSLTVAEAVGKLNRERMTSVSRIDKGPLLVNSRHDLFDRKRLKYQDFNIDFGRIRYLSHLISQQAPPEIREFNLLEQQISEIVKNAIRHGNQNDIRKKVKVWYSFDSKNARLIVQDEGPGFKNLEEWNEFYHNRMKCFYSQDYEGMSDFISYRTDASNDEDGGNALFAAVEYWNLGVVYDDSRTAVAVGKEFV